MRVIMGVEPDKISIGHPSGQMAELIVLRDVMTELLIASQATPSVFRLLGIHDAPMIVGVTGVAIHASGDGPGGLAIFTKSAGSGAEKFIQPLQSRGLPIHVIENVSFRSAQRPVQGGGSVGHGSPAGASGTMGCVVRSRKTGSTFVLTCNHVIAELNTATIGATEVWAPASGKGGTHHDRLGVVEDFARIDFSPGAYNVIDAALARPDRATDIDPTVLRIGTLSGINTSPRFNDAMRKSGVASGRTNGTYLYDMNAQVIYDDGSSALFRDMIGIVGTTKNFAMKGDSGAIVLDDTAAAVGMIISVASGIDLTLATRIRPVIDYFDVDVA